MNAVNEQWSLIPGCDGYIISSLGRVLSLKHREPQFLAQHVDGRGYLRVALSVPGDDSGCVHALVARAFLGPRPDGPMGEEIRHLDGNPLNNSVGNLRYGTRSENQQDAVRHRTNANTKKTHCRRGHQYDANNTYLDPTGRRQCRTCKSAADRSRKARRQLERAA